MSYLLPLAFHGKFDTSLRPYSGSAGDWRWISVGVAFRTIGPYGRRIEDQLSSKCVSQFVRGVL